MTRARIQDYARADIEACADIARGSRDGFTRTALVAMMSARRKFDIVGDVVESVERYGVNSIWPSAAQKRGIAWLQSTKGAELFDTLANNEMVRHAPAIALAHATQCPALGLAKGGFLCQLMGIDVGCLDTHNVDRFEIPRDRVRLRKEASLQARARSIAAYVRLCADLGGSVALWGGWCEYLATMYPDTYHSGADVSARHVAYVGGVPF